ncbi:MAG TPA: hypothetical protein EYH16_00715 [Leucothrix mucor]|nr:hypothetical protein [Leucothrix mucor]
MKQSLFSAWFINDEPEIFKTIENTKQKLRPFFIAVGVLCLAVLLSYFILPAGLVISFATLVVIFLLFISNVLFFPSILVASDVFFSSRIKIKVAVFILNGLLLLGVSLYITYSLMPFLLGGLELYANSKHT